MAALSIRADMEGRQEEWARERTGQDGGEVLKGTELECEALASVQEMKTMRARMRGWERESEMV
jgi:hypothetical protein